MSVLLDSNLIIYAAKKEHSHLRQFLYKQSIVASAISELEVLGYHQLNSAESKYFGLFFKEIKVMAIDYPIIKAAINLKQKKKMTLGDSIIAATCLEHQLALATHNTKDFEWIESIQLIDPLTHSL